VADRYVLEQIGHSWRGFLFAGLTARLTRQSYFNTQKPWSSLRTPRTSQMAPLSEGRRLGLIYRYVGPIGSPQLDIRVLVRVKNHISKDDSDCRLCSLFVDVLRRGSRVSRSRYIYNFRLVLQTIITGASVPSIVHYYVFCLHFIPFRTVGNQEN
jgi:hypothetical protein